MKKKALSVFRQPPDRWNCAQAVLHACQETGKAQHLAIEDFRQSGGGKAPQGECGALFAACQAAPEKADEIREAFLSQNGATTCHDLKKIHRVPCEQSVGSASAILEGVVGGGCACRMRVAIPLRGDGFCEHFGGAEQFAFFEISKASGVVKEERFEAPEHQPGALPRWLAAQEVDAVIASAIGERAILMLAEAGIPVFLADQGVPVSGLIQAYIEGKLPQVNTQNSRCQGHGHDGHKDHQGCTHHNH